MSKVYSIKDITNYENHIGYDLRTPDGKDIRFSDNIEHNPFMYNEIKEILDKPKILMLSYGNYISLDDYVKLKDYITNLQEENRTLKELNVCVGCNNNPDYKSRNEKAREFIIEKCIISDMWEEQKFNKFIPIGCIKYKPLSSKNTKKLYNILGGDDNE